MKWKWKMYNIKYMEICCFGTLLETRVTEQINVHRKLVGKLRHYCLSEDGKGYVIIT